MSYQVEFEAEAIDDLDRMDATIRQRLLRKINWLGLNFEEVSHQGLSDNLSGSYKLRVGDYRVIYLINSEEALLVVLRVGHRSEIYDM
jgi:mRNA interferase RelE/StbE